MTSIGNMIKRISGLSGTKDVTDWESDFIDSVVMKTNDGTQTIGLSEKQVEIVLRIHNKHFA